MKLLLAFLLLLGLFHVPHALNLRVNNGPRDRSLNADLDTSSSSGQFDLSERDAQTEAPADAFIETLETIRADLDNAEQGTSLGTMVETQLKLTELEDMYKTMVGIPNKVSNQVQSEAQEVKRGSS